MDRIEQLLVDGQSITTALLLPVVGVFDDWKEHPGSFIEIRSDTNPEEALTVRWIWDEQDFDIVGAVFTGDDWTPAKAQAWLASEEANVEVAMAISTGREFSLSHARDRGAIPATYHYLRRLIANLRSHVAPEAYEAAQRDARSHAGGVIRAESRADPEEKPPLSKDKQPDPAPSRAHAFGMAVNFTDMPSTPEGDGKIWKCVSRVAKVWNPLTGDPAEVTEAMIDGSIASFGRAFPYVDIPIGHHLDAPDKNTGWVRHLEKRIAGDEIQMWGLLEFTDPEMREKVANRSIADVSAWFDPNVVDQRDGATIYPWAVRHVCLTNKPLMVDLGAFSTDQHLVVGDEKAVWFSVVQPSVQEERMKYSKGKAVKVRVATGAAKVNTPYSIGEAREPGFYRIQSGDVDLGWVPEDLLEEAEPELVASFSMTDEQLERVLAARGFSLQAIQSTNEELGKVRDGNRKTRIQQLLFAFDSKVPFEGVVAHPGFRLAPALIKQIEKVLKEAPGAMKFAVDMLGVTPVDQIVIDIVNAIPPENRISEKEPKTPRYNVFGMGGGTDEVEEDEDEMNDDSIKSLSMMIGR